MQHIPVKSQIASLGSQILKAGIWLTVLQLCIFSFTCLLLDEISWIIGYQKPPLLHTTQLFMQLLCTRYGFSLLLDLGINCLFSTYQLFHEPKTFDTLSSKALIVFNMLFIGSIFLQTQTILGKHIYTIACAILTYKEMWSTPILEELLFGFGSIALYGLTPTYAYDAFSYNDTLKEYIFAVLHVISLIMFMVLIFLMIFPITLNTALASHINAILVKCLAHQASLSLTHGLFDYRPLLYIILVPIGGSSLWFMMERVWGVCFFSFKNADILYSRYKNQNLKVSNAP